VLEVDGEPINDLRAPALGLLFGHNVPADAPVKRDQFAVDRKGGLDLGGADAGLEVLEERGIAGGQMSHSP
jgi:hypothetical protein